MARKKVARDRRSADARRADPHGGRNSGKPKPLYEQIDDEIKKIRAQQRLASF